MLQEVEHGDMLPSMPEHPIETAIHPTDLSLVMDFGVLYQNDADAVHFDWIVNW